MHPLVFSLPILVGDPLPLTPDEHRRQIAREADAVCRALRRLTPSERVRTRPDSEAVASAFSARQVRKFARRGVLV